MNHLLKLSRKGISAVIFILFIFTLNIHCGSDGSSIASDPELLSTQKIEESLAGVADIAGTPTSNHPATREEQLDKALLLAATRLRVAVTEIESGLTSTMLMDLADILDTYRENSDTYTWLKNLNFLDLNGDGRADQALEEFIASIKNLAAVFSGMMDIAEMGDYTTEVQSDLSSLLNILKQIDTMENTLSILESITSFSLNKLTNLFSDEDDIYNVIPGLADTVDMLKSVLSGDMSIQTVPSILDNLIPMYRIFAEKLRENAGDIIITPMPLLLISGNMYYYLTNGGLARYIDGYDLDEINGENLLEVDTDLAGGLIGILLYFRSLLGGSTMNTEARLSNLTPSAGTLTPVFSAETLSYSVLVPRNIASITVTPAVPGNDMDISVNGSPVNSGSSSQPVALQTDSYTTITIEVSDSESGTAKTYTVSARRIGDSTATLSGLAVSAGTMLPAFNADRLDYSVEVDNDISSIQVTPATASAFSTIRVNENAVTSGDSSDPVALNVSTNLLSVRVTAEDNSTCTYTITVKRLGSHIADLSAITLSQGTLTPSFSSGTLSYTAEVANAITSLTVTPATTESHAMIDVNGVASTSGTAVTMGNLLVGANTIRIVVTAQDGTTTKIYTVAVTRKASSNANLAGLTISQGTLSPAFAAGTTSYSATVANAVTSITVTPVVEDGTATVKVNGTSVASGSTSQAISLATGANTISVAVTAQDGVTVKTYTVTVTRQKSNNAYLSGLYVRDCEINFSSSTTYYEDYETLFTTGTRVTPTASHAGAAIRVNGQTVASGYESQYIDFGYGNNYLYITVTAEDGVTTRTYTVKILRF